MPRSGFTIATYSCAAVHACDAALAEPFTSPGGSILSPIVLVDVDPVASTAAFYQRLQFTGTSKSNDWLPRVKILDLAACRKT